MPLITDTSWVSHPLESGGMLLAEMAVIGGLACGVIPVLVILFQQFILRKK